MFIQTDSEAQAVRLARHSYSQGYGKRAKANSSGANEAARNHETRAKHHELMAESLREVGVMLTLGSVAVRGLAPLAAGAFAAAELAENQAEKERKKADQIRNQAAEKARKEDARRKAAKAKAKAEAAVKAKAAAEAKAKAEAAAKAKAEEQKRKQKEQEQREREIRNRDYERYDYVDHDGSRERYISGLC